jgi:predicted metal-dependent HD superfamily phosphohydrolase
MPVAERWARTWATVGRSAPRGEYEALMARYAEPARHYHTVQHLGECFAVWDTVRELAARPGECELALWYHDAVYDPFASDNEARSADLAAAALGGDDALTTNVRTMILATRHDASAPSGDASLVVDVDLAILGAAPQRFEEYERQVREEYSWVPGPMFRSKRRQILAGFLARDVIYQTPQLRERFEAKARVNLARSIEALGG